MINSSARVFAVKFAEDKSRNVFFWMQEPESARCDLSYVNGTCLVLGSLLPCCLGSQNATFVYGLGTASPSGSLLVQGPEPSGGGKVRHRSSRGGRARTGIPEHACPSDRGAADARSAH